MKGLVIDKKLWILKKEIYQKQLIIMSNLLHHYLANKLKKLKVHFYFFNLKLILKIKLTKHDWCWVKAI